MPGPIRKPSSRLLLPALLALAAAAPALGQEPAPGEDAAADPARVYIVQLREPAAVPAMAGTAARAGTRTGIRSRISPSRRFDARSAAVQSYAAGLVESHDRALAAVGAADAKVYSYRLAFNGFAARLKPAQAAKLAQQPGVAGVWEDSVRYLQTNASPAFLGLTDPSAGLRSALGLKGEDVVIGVIDSGIAPDHPSFADKIEKKKPRVCRTDWAQNSLLGAWLCARYKKPRYTVAYEPPQDWHGRCETGPGFAATDCNGKLVGARFYLDGFQQLYSMDEGEFLSPHDADGHGTHIASIAAGNPVKAALGGTAVATVSGMAPRARIAVYKACWLEPGATRGTCAMSDLQRAIEDAIADGVDVLNYAVGTSAGGPTDPDSLALLEASDAGVLAVVAAGNGGPGPETIESPGSAPWVLTVAASSRGGQRYDEVVRATEPPTSVGDFASKEGAFTPSLKAAGAIEDLLVLADDGEPATSDGCQALENDATVSGHIVLIRRGTCTFQEKIANAEAAGARAAVIYSDTGGPIIMTGERGSVGIPAVMIGAADGNFLATRLATGDAVKVRLEKGLIATRTDPGNVVYAQSARGPNPITGDILKPDVVAPGVDILGAQTREVANGVRGERYQYLSGTSMAVPHVAGVAALLKEAHPDWSPAAIRSALVTTARQDLHKEDGATPADPFDFGGGHIVPNAANAPGLVYDAGRDDYDAFACGAGIPRVSEEDCAALADAGYPTAIDELNLPSLSQGGLVGERTVRRRVTNVGEAATWQAVVDPPAGVGMSVSPGLLALGAGETGEFTVTFSNLGDAARLGEWGFGALTWSNGSRLVRSPVAVRTAPLAAPATVSGTGATGETGFDVEFGYAGAYSATFAGLVAPLTFAGTVLDDPLDLYNIIRDDDALPDHIRRVRVTVPAGARYLRVALTGTDAGSQDDLDLYLLCPNAQCPGGNEGLASTGNAADEVIDIQDPDPGEYVIDVHGFQVDDVTGGPGANFAVRAWAVTGGPGAGNVALSAPVSATVGGSGTVGLAWQDLARGEVYLGLVAHGDGDRELAQTLLEVVVD